MYKVIAIIRKVWGDTQKHEWKAESHDELVKVKGVIDYLTIHSKTAKLVSMTVIPEAES